MVKPTVRIINVARGGIVDENALYAALKEGRVAGAALDVFAKEPCTDSPLFELDQVVVTPHLGASTHEAQEKAGTQVARSVKLALAGEFVPDAVNVQGGVVAEDVKPGLPLAEKLGRVFTALAGEVATRLDVEVRGEIVRARRAGARARRAQGRVHRRGRGVGDLRQRPAARQGPRRRRSSWSPARRARTGGTSSPCAACSPTAATVSVSGTLSGPRQITKLVEVNGFDMEIEPTDHLAFFTYIDRPGIVGIVGRSSASTASTSPPCRCPGTRRAARRSSRSPSTPRSRTRSSSRSSAGSAPRPAAGWTSAD